MTKKGTKRAQTDFNPYVDRNPEDFTTPEPTLVRRVGLSLKYSVQAVKPTVVVVDGSHWNEINFEELKNNGVVAIILKCSEGAEDTYYEFKDPKFEENWQTALDYGFAVMVYHFNRGYKGSAEKSWFMKCADNFLNDERINGETAVALDCEWKPSSMSTATYANRAFGFCSLIAGEGMRQMIYSSPGLVPQLFPAGETRWGDVWGWDAHWTHLPEPTLPPGWSWDMMVGWQRGISNDPNHYWIPDVNGGKKIDYNLFYFADEQELRDWLGQEVVIPTPDCCEEHDLRIATLEAGQQVLTEVQNDLLARMGAVEANFASLSDKVSSHEYAIGQVRLDMGMMQQQVDTIHANIRKAGEALIGDE